MTLFNIIKVITTGSGFSTRPKCGDYKRERDKERERERERERESEREREWEREREREWEREKKNKQTANKSVGFIWIRKKFILKLYSSRLYLECCAKFWSPQKDRKAWKCSTEKEQKNNYS